ncbi:MAG: phosphoadenylyl-sulfate reductase [Bacteroidota bacterium]
MSNDLSLKELQSLLRNKPAEKALRILSIRFPGETVFTTSFGIEDQVLTDIIFTNDLQIEVATLDTGRLFPETYKVFSRTLEKYKKQVKVYFPDHEHVEKMVTEKGPYSFYESVTNRAECCRIRKVLPLARALKGNNFWVSGIRAEQSENRSQMDRLEFDPEKKIFKLYPLYDWTYADIKKYITDNAVPYNSLHDNGFVSIGCEPCTRAIKKGEDFRAGRWWWENEGTKECGCHIK